MGGSPMNIRSIRAGLTNTVALPRTGHWAGFVVLLLAACTSSPNPNLVHHVVIADNEGQALHCLDLEVIENPCPSYTAMLENARKTIDERHEEALKSSSPDGAPRHVRRLLIHIHGGLKSPSASLQLAEDALERMDGEEFQHWSYPIFLIWPSDFPSTAEDHLLWIRRGRRARYWGPVTSPFVFATDLARGIATAPISIGATLLNDAGLAYAVATGRTFLPSFKNAEKIRDHVQKDENPAYDLFHGEYRRGFLPQAGRFLSYWLTFLPKLVVQTLALDGIGRGAWDVMKRRTSSVFFADEEFETRRTHELDRHLASSGRGAFSQFMSCLQQHVKSSDGQDPYEITFVVHSMGAIAMNRILREYAAGRLGDLPLQNVVYMAPACSVGNAADAIVPALQYSAQLAEATPGREPMHFYLLTLHPMSESDEAQWSALDLTPRGSLLEWIDNFYTDPPSHLDRVFGKWVNAIQALHLFHSVSEQVSFKAFDSLPDTRPRAHGDFNECPFWREEFWATSGWKHWPPQDQRP